MFVTSWEYFCTVRRPKFASTTQFIDGQTRQILPLYRPSRFHASAIVIHLDEEYTKSKLIVHTCSYQPIPFIPTRTWPCTEKDTDPESNRSLLACPHRPECTKWAKDKQATSQTNTKNTRNKETKTNDTQYSNQKVKKQRNKQANKQIKNNQAINAKKQASEQTSRLRHAHGVHWVKTQLWKGWQIKHWESLEVSVVDQDLHHKTYQNLSKRVEVQEMPITSLHFQHRSIAPFNIAYDLLRQQVGILLLIVG